MKYNLFKNGNMHKYIEVGESSPIKGVEYSSHGVSNAPYSMDTFH
jgi:hypothetical protein